MSRFRVTVWLFAVFIIITGLDLWAQGVDSRPMGPNDIAHFFEAAAHPRLSAKGFAREVEKRTLLAAASVVREKNLKEKTVEVDLRLKVTLIPGPFPPDPPEFPPVPGPDEIDMCWEICFDLECYLGCSGPGFDFDYRPLRTCKEIWEDYNEANSTVRRIQYLEELLRWGCLEKKEVVIDFKPIELFPR